MTTLVRRLVVVTILALLPAAVLRAQGGPPVTTGGGLGSKPWLHGALPRVQVLPVVTGGTLSSKPWLGLEAGQRRPQQWITRDGSISSKPWLLNEWRRPRVEIGPVTSAEAQP